MVEFAEMVEKAPVTGKAEALSKRAGLEIFVA